MDFLLHLVENTYNNFQVTGGEDQLAKVQDIAGVHKLLPMKRNNDET